MNNFFIHISLAGRLIKHEVGFEHSIRAFQKHLVVRGLFHLDQRAFFCFGHFFDGCSSYEFMRWLERYEPDDIESWIKERDGDFFIVVYDRQVNTIKLCADRNGQLRLYYSSDGREVYITDSLVQMAARRGGSTLSNAGVFYLLNLKFSLDPYTLLDDVYASTPGTYTEFSADGILTKHYHHPVELDAEYYTSMEECVQGLDQAFRATFQKRYEPSKKCLILLSGGIDSVTMLRYLSEIARGNVSALTFGFESDRTAPDIKAARLTAQHFGVEHEVCFLNPDEVGSYVADCFTNADGPHFGNAQALYLKSVAGSMIGENYIFSGEDTRLHTPMFDFPKSVGILSSGSTSRYSKTLLAAALRATRFWPFRGKRTFSYWRSAATPRRSVQDYLLEIVIGSNGNSNKGRWYQKLEEEMPRLSQNASIQEIFKRFISFEYRTQFTDDINATVSAFDDDSQKVHFPFYDHQVVEACNRVPYHLGSQQMFTLHSWSWIPFTQKAVLRHLLMRDVPPHLVFRRKATMPSIHYSFNGRLRALVIDILERWGNDLRDVLDEDNRLAVMETGTALRETAHYEFPEHHDLLWNSFCIAYLAVLNQICAKNLEAIGEVKSMWEAVRVGR